MKKTDRKRLDDALDKALAPPRKMPKLALDNLLDEYDDPTTKVKDSELSTAVPQYRSTAAVSRKGQAKQWVTAKPAPPLTGVPEYRSTAATEQRHKPSTENKTGSPAIPTSNFYRKANEVVDQLDRELTPAESKVFDHLIRLSIGFNKDWCQVRISTLQERTGYRSDKTVRAAINGLVIKGRIARRTHHNNPLGDEYLICQYRSTGVPEYRSTPVEITPVLESKITGHLNTIIKEKRIDDDDALAEFANAWREAAKEITGRELSRNESERWRELAELLITELKIASTRTTVSSIPAFLTEHLRRRLWKKDQQQLSDESKAADGGESKPSNRNLDVSKCPDCRGSGMYYPEGYEKSVAKCKHERLIAMEN